MHVITSLTLSQWLFVISPIALIMFVFGTLSGLLLADSDEKFRATQRGPHGEPLWPEGRSFCMVGVSAEQSEEVETVEASK